MTGVWYGGVQEFCPRKNIIITTKLHADARVQV